MFYGIVPELYRRAQDPLEAEQTLVRMTVGAVLVACVYWVMPSEALRTAALVITGAYATASFTIIGWLLIAPRPSRLRRLVGLGCDISAASSFSYLSPSHFLYMYTSTVLFIGIGNGFRYSANYLRLTTILGVAVLLTINYVTPFWGHPAAAWLLAALYLFLLSAYVLRFLRERDDSESLLAERGTKLEDQTKELVRAKSELQDALNTRDKFLSKISHELRTPLHNMQQILNRLTRSNCNLPTDDFHGLRVCAELVQDQVGNVLQFADPRNDSDQDQLECFDIVDLLHGLVVAARVEALKRSLSLTLSIGFGFDPIVKGPSEAIRQIVWNLLVNGIKFTNVGSVTVYLSELTTDVAAHRRLSIVVKDTGIGIASEHIEKIWEPFFQADTVAGRAQGGTGLGLSIAMERAKRIGAQLSVRSGQQIGSEFTLDIRMSKPTPEELQDYQEPPERALTTRRSLRILVAEDDDYSRTIVEDALKNAGHEVLTCTDGAQTLEILRGAEVFDVAVIDRHLPNMEASEIVKQYNAARGIGGNQRAPLLIMWTAGLTVKAKDEALRAGFDRVFPKRSRWMRDLGQVLRAASERGPVSGSTEGGRRFSRTVRQESFEKYQAWMQEAIPKIEESLEAGDLPRLIAMLHQLRGHSALMGTTIPMIIRPIQIAARVGDLNNALDAWRSALPEIQRAMLHR